MVMRTTFLHNTIRPDTGLSLCFRIYSAIIVTYFEHFQFFDPIPVLLFAFLHPNFLRCLHA